MIILAMLSAVFALIISFTLVNFVKASSAVATRPNIFVMTSKMVWSVDNLICQALPSSFELVILSIFFSSQSTELTKLDTSVTLIVQDISNSIVTQVFAWSEFRVCLKQVPTPDSPDGHLTWNKSLAEVLFGQHSLLPDGPRSQDWFYAFFARDPGTGQQGHKFAMTHTGWSCLWWRWWRSSS